MNKQTAPFPPGFTRGLPTHEGTFVLLTYESGTYELHVREIQEVPSGKSADLLNVRPGLCVINDFECFEYWEVDDYGIVGYMELEGVSAFELWSHRGMLGKDDLRLTDRAIEVYLAGLRAKLKAVVFEGGVIDLNKLPYGFRVGPLDVEKATGNAPRKRD